MILQMRFVHHGIFSRVVGPMAPKRRPDNLPVGQQQLRWVAAEQLVVDERAVITRNEQAAADAGGYPAIREQFRLQALNTVFGANDDVQVASKEISLICPISRALLRNPCRGPECRHVECFDLNSFLDAASKIKSRRDPSADCPFAECRGHIRASSLILDWWIKSLVEMHGSDQVRKLVFYPDGGLEAASDRSRGADIEVEGFSQIPTQLARDPAVLLRRHEFDHIHVKRERGLASDEHADAQTHRLQPAPEASLLFAAAPAVDATPSEAQPQSSYVHNGIAVTWDHSQSQPSGTDVVSLTYPSTSAAGVGAGTQLTQRTSSGSQADHFAAEPICGVCGRRPQVVFGDMYSLACCGQTAPKNQWTHRAAWTAAPGTSSNGGGGAEVLRFEQQPGPAVVVTVLPAWKGCGYIVAHLAGVLTRNDTFEPVAARCWVADLALTKAEVNYVKALCEDAVQWLIASTEGRAVNAKDLPTSRRDTMPPRFLPMRGS
jgi:hypothetical protein